MTAFDWDDANIEHIAAHQVTPEEAEEALADPDRVQLRAYSLPTERRWAVIGATEGSRILAVVFTRRRRLIRVVTARDANNQERRSYRRQRKSTQ